MSKEYDLVILGGGTGGYVAAIRGAQLGLSVALVEKEKLGGTCLHRGCIPTKAMLESANFYRNLANAEKFGIDIQEYGFDLASAQKRTSEIVEQLHQGVQTLMKKHQISVYQGYGRILGPSIFSPLPGTISVEHDNGTENTMLIPKNVIIATGAKPVTLKSVVNDGEYIYNSDQLLKMKELPKTMTIVGAGIIGIEWASMLQDLGVEVRIIEQAGQILHEQDKDIRKAVEKALRKRGVEFLLNSSLLGYEKDENGQLHIELEVNGVRERRTTEKILVAVGRQANISDLGLENTAIEIEDGKIVTNEFFQTKESHIYAIGDCRTGMELAHVAAIEGMTAVEHMANLASYPLDDRKIPMCIYSYPEVGSIGLTEEAAEKQGYELKVSRFPFLANGKALIKGEENGFIKLIVDAKTDDILGIHILGLQATDMISEGALAKTLDASSWELSKTIRPHPSLAEVWTEVSLQIEDKAIHL